MEEAGFLSTFAIRSYLKPESLLVSDDQIMADARSIVGEWYSQRQGQTPLLGLRVSDDEGTFGLREQVSNQGFSEMILIYRFLIS